MEALDELADSIAQAELHELPSRLERILHLGRGIHVALEEILENLQHHLLHLTRRRVKQLVSKSPQRLFWQPRRETVLWHHVSPFDMSDVLQRQQSVADERQDGEVGHQCRLRRARLEVGTELAAALLGVALELARSEAPVDGVVRALNDTRIDDLKHELCCALRGG